MEQHRICIYNNLLLTYFAADSVPPLQLRRRRRSSYEDLATNTNTNSEDTTTTTTTRTTTRTPGNSEDRTTRNPNYENTSPGSTKENKRKNQTREDDPLLSPYSIGVSEVACYSWDDSKQEWITDGSVRKRV